MMYDCDECKKSFSCFMVKDEIWKDAGLDNGVLCFQCLEKRLGRNLKLSDFEIGVRANDHLFYMADIIGKEVGGKIEQTYSLLEKHEEIKNKNDERAQAIMSEYQKENKNRESEKQIHQVDRVLFYIDEDLPFELNRISFMSSCLIFIEEQLQDYKNQFLPIIRVHIKKSCENPISSDFIGIKNTGHILLCAQQIVDNSKGKMCFEDPLKSILFHFLHEFYKLLWCADEFIVYRDMGEDLSFEEVSDILNEDNESEKELLFKKYDGDLEYIRATCTYEHAADMAAIKSLSYLENLYHYRNIHVPNDALVYEMVEIDEDDPLVNEI